MMDGLKFIEHMENQGYLLLKAAERQGVIWDLLFQLPERLTLSVAFGWGNYTSTRDSYANREMQYSSGKEPLRIDRNALLRDTWDAEIAIWDTHNRWLKLDEDSVMGYVPFPRIPHIIDQYLFKQPREWFDYRLFAINQTKYWEQEYGGVWGLTFAKGGRQRLW